MADSTQFISGRTLTLFAARGSIGNVVRQSLDDLRVTESDISNVAGVGAIDHFGARKTPLWVTSIGLPTMAARSDLRSHRKLGVLKADSAARTSGVGGRAAVPGAARNRRAWPDTDYAQSAKKRH